MASGSTQYAHAIDQAVAGKPIDRNRMYLPLGSPRDPLFVDHVRPNTDPRDHLCVYVRTGSEEATVLLTHRVVTAHDHNAVRVLEDDVFGVAVKKAFEVVSVVLTLLALDCIVGSL